MSAYIRIAIYTLQSVTLFILLLACISPSLSHFDLASVTEIIVSAAVILLLGCGVFSIVTRAIFRTSTFVRWLASCAGELEGWVKKISPAQVRLAIIVTAGLTLFLELTLIRWESSAFAVFSLYKNLALLSCFCGIGLGYALVRETRLLLVLSLPMLAALLVELTLLRFGLPPMASGFCKSCLCRKRPLYFSPWRA